MMDLRNEMLAGTVYIKHKKYRWLIQKRYAVAYSGRELRGVEASSDENRQAHLIIYKLKSHDSDVVEKINFSSVLGVSAGPSGITLRLRDSSRDLKFRAKRSSGNKQWMKVCTLLNAFPNSSIPKAPELHRSLLRPGLATSSAQYCELYNACDAWAVHVLSGSVADRWNIVGLHVVTIGKEDGMLNVIHSSTGVTRLKASRHDILRCGFWNTMVCLEVFVGLRGVLWMDCFQDQVKQIRDKIHNFAFYGIDARLPPLSFPRFFSDLPFSPRCYFDNSQRSRSNSASSQGSEWSDHSSRPEEGQPLVNMSTHPKFVKMTTSTNKYLSHRSVDHNMGQKPEIVVNRRRTRSILLEPDAQVEPEEYIVPVSTKSHVTLSHDEQYMQMHSVTCKCSQ